MKEYNMVFKLLNNLIIKYNTERIKFSVFKGKNVSKVLLFNCFNNSISCIIYLSTQFIIIFNCFLNI